MTLARIFEPRSIVVVGASTDPGKRGHQILRALGESGYAGAVHAVNPAGGKLMGHTLLRSLEELPAGVDLAVLCTPAATAPGLVRACGKRGVGGAVVLAVGFGESGAAGTRLEAELGAAGRDSGVRVIGPNTSGLLNLLRGVNLIGARGMRPGGIALLVQSGNIALGLMNEITRRTALGISICCGLGNEVDVGFGEVLEFLGGHDETTGVIAHVEGCKDGRALLNAAATVTRHKPVVVVKSGRTGAGAEAAVSHTGAVAGPYDRLRAGLAQAGVVEVVRTDELSHIAETLVSQLPGPAGGGIAILSDGGGQNTLAVDYLVEMGAPLAELEERTMSALRTHLGPAAAVRNPVDVAGAADTDPGVFPRAMKALAADPAVGVVLVVGLFGGYGIRFSEGLADIETAAADDMAATMRAAGKGLVVQSLYTAMESKPLDALRQTGVPVIESLEVACRAVAELQRRGNRRADRDDWRAHGGDRQDSADPFTVTLSATAKPLSIASTRHRAIIAARSDGRTTLTELEAREVLGDCGLALEPAEVIRSGVEAAEKAVRAPHNVALKLLSRHITHKSDARGVVLDIRTPEDARIAFESIVANARSYARARGLPVERYTALASPMLPKPIAEFLIGAYRDPQLGPVLTIGAGGIWVEVFRDVAHRVLPADDSEIASMLSELKAHVLLTGTRGQASVRTGPIMAAASAVAQSLLKWQDIAEAEVNPLFVYEDRVVPVDARVVLTKERGAAGLPE
ncbi:MAG: acetate--CoA ligase family protein [Deltaproteobacteria bacterium]|nr:acetate--CoA ligase family protein [Deltaproteobacteria bacterium]MDE0035891.1 acetate--CoA ligase family protein [Deltaproteobacteria bacterium]